MVTGFSSAGPYRRVDDAVLRRRKERYIYLMGYIATSLPSLFFTGKADDDDGDDD